MRIREKVFGPGQAVPLDRNAKVRVLVYAKGWTALHRRPGQHKGPITRAFLEVLEVLLWGFHNSRSGACFPSYERIAEKAGCARSTVAEALKALELAGVLSWQHRIVRVRERCRDLFGANGWRWRVVRTSNAYGFFDPKASASGNRTGTLTQEIPNPAQVALPDGGGLEPSLAWPESALGKALAGLGRALEPVDPVTPGPCSC